MAIKTISRDFSQSMYSPEMAPVTKINSGDQIIFSTHDARGGVLLERPTGIAFDLPRPTPGLGNPVTGPVAVVGAKPGDALLVHILHIACDPIGWCGGHAHAGAVRPGRVRNPLGRTCDVSPTGIVFSPEITLPLKPMIGCIGTAPAEAATTGVAGPHGGNMDQPVVGSGTSILLPVFVEGALLALGDAHAVQSDGELGSVEMRSVVTLSCAVIKGRSRAMHWPRIETTDSIVTVAVGRPLEDALRSALRDMILWLEEDFGMSKHDAYLLIGAAGHARPGQAQVGLFSMRCIVPKAYLPPKAQRPA